MPPGRIRPRFSASRSRPRAVRSLIEPPGFSHSALPRISQPVASDARRKRINGVRPTAAAKLARAWIMPVPSGLDRRLGFGLGEAKVRFQLAHAREPLFGVGRS